MNAEGLVGMLAGVLTSAANLPQVVKAFRSRSTDDISLPTQLALLSGLVLWVIYGFAITDHTLIAFNLIGAVLTLALAAIKVTEKS